MGARGCEGRFPQVFFGVLREMIIFVAKKVNGMKKIIFLASWLLVVANGAAATRKTLLVIIDGIPADCIERLQPPTLMDIARMGGYQRGYCGGEVGTYSETPTISAIGYTNILTGTWMNKHNVRGNDHVQANYNYPTIFRTAKDQRREVSTAVYSSWTDNRTVLLGEGLEATRGLKIDYVCDGYDNDTVRFPHREGDLHIRDIDGQVCKDAAQCIGEHAPDLNWLYLWYTDDAFHQHGGGVFADEAVMNVDKQLRYVLDAVRERERHHGEEWLVIVVTDHGREVWGRGHGGQTPRERTVWMITNQKRMNSQFRRPTLSHVDIHPTICEWMKFEVPQEVAFERDGISFIGATDIHDLKVSGYDHQAQLEWQADGVRKSTMAVIYVSTTNRFAEGGKDEWVKVGEVPACNGRATVDLTPYGASGLYKFVVKTPRVVLTKWLKK